MISPEEISSVVSEEYLMLDNKISKLVNSKESMNKLSKILENLFLDHIIPKIIIEEARRVVRCELKCPITAKEFKNLLREKIRDYFKSLE